VGSELLLPEQVGFELIEARQHLRVDLQRGTADAGFSALSASLEMVTSAAGW
jgi:hypothetical protein